MTNHPGRLRARVRRSIARTIALLAIALLVIAAGLAVATAARLSAPARADTAPVTGQPATVSADGLPTVQINGVVWAQVTVGTTVYATGSFSAARPAGVAVGGTGSVRRSNLLAYDITTGKLITGFNHALNAQGRSIAASPDGSEVYVGGDFTTVDGQAHRHLAAFAVRTGALIPTFAATLNGTVNSIATTATTVFVGGSFTTANGSARRRIAAYTPAGGLLGWNPGANGTVAALTMTPDRTRVIAGGSFSTLAGIRATGMGSVDATTGAGEPWAANTVIKDSGASGEIDSLSSDATQVYGAGYFFTTGGNFEGRFAADPKTGKIVWLNNCHGDSYSVFPVAHVLYSAGHEHDCSDISWFSQNAARPFDATHHFLAAEQTTPNGHVNRVPIYPCCPHYSSFAGQPTANQLDWYPTLTEGSYTGQDQAAWSVTGNSRYLSVGGEFPKVNGVAQQGLVRFAIPSIAPNRIGPARSASLTPTVRSQSAGTARVGWRATWDEDNTTLTYALYRDGRATAIYTTTHNSTFFDRPNLGHLDTGLRAGSRHSYQIRVTDPFGNTVTSGSTRVTIGSASTPSYTALVLRDGARHFWPLSERAGSTLAADRAGYADVVLAGKISLGVPGPIAGSATAATFAGGETTPSPKGPPGRPPTPVPNDTAGTAGNVEPGGAFSVEAWFKTTSTHGGALLDYGVFSAADSEAIDKVLYLDRHGRVHFGVQNNATLATVNATAADNDGGWHLAIGTYSRGRARLFVDGALVASKRITDNIAFDGYWRVGGDNLTGWTAAPTTGYLAATIGDVAVYPSALSAARIASHFTLGRRH